jgi:REP element-mobilizing transposase RayT
MPDHLHLLVGPGEIDVMKFAASWKSHTTRLSWAAGNKGALWQPRPWDRTIRSDEDFTAVAEYVLRNPVAAGLVGAEREWKHSWTWWWDS